MASPSSVLTQGVGAWGSASLMVTMGFGVATVITPTVTIPVGTVITAYNLSAQIDPSPCDAARERWNWNRLHKLLGVLDNVFDISFSGDGHTVTINLTPDAITATDAISSPRFTDDAGVSLCPRYCSQAAAEYITQAARGATTPKRRGKRKSRVDYAAQSLAAAIVAGAIPP